MLAVLVITSSAGAQTLGFLPAAHPLIAKLQQRYPGSSSRFVNCPGANTLPLQDGGDGHVCEFRLLIGRGIVKGSALMVPHGGRWAAKGGIFKIGPIPTRTRRCGLRKLAQANQDADSLSAHGVSCGEARYLATMIGYRALNAPTLRLPSHFTEGENGTNTLGFVTGRFHCRGRTRVKQGRINPYGHETASCRSRFGDRFRYVFDQGS